MDAQETRKRLRFSAGLKGQILAECEAPGASVAKEALAHGINAKILHGWHARSSARRAPIRQQVSLLDHAGVLSGHSGSRAVASDGWGQASGDRSIGPPDRLLGNAAT